MLQQLAEQLIQDVQLTQGVKPRRRIEVVYVKSENKLRVSPMDYRKGFDLYIIDGRVSQEVPF